MSRLSECFRKADLSYNHQLSTTQNDYRDLNSFGEVINLPSFKYLSPTRARYRGDLNFSSNFADVPVIIVKDGDDGEHVDLPDLDTGVNFTDCNHNVTSKRKRLLLGAVPEKHTYSIFASYANQKHLSNTKIVGDCDISESRLSAGCSQPAKKKQARGAGSSTAKGRGRGKKEETGGENKKPRKPRKAKDGANTQMKLQLASDQVDKNSEYEDALADDPYVYESSSPSSRKSAASYKRSRPPNKISGTDDQCIPPLAQRVHNNMPHEQSQVTQSQPGVKHFSSFSAGVIPSMQSSSQRASRLFDEMLELQSPTVHRERNQSFGIGETDRRLSQVVEVAADWETEFVPR